MSRRPRKAVSQPVPPRPRRSPRRAALLVCGLLLLAVWLVFGRTTDYGFVNYDDEMNLYGNPADPAGTQRRRDSLGVDHDAWKPVVPDHAVVLPGRLRSLRSESAGLPPHERPLLHSATTVLLFLALWRMTGRLCPPRLPCDHGLCRSSAARRIGRLAGRAERFAERAGLSC